MSRERPLCQYVDESGEVCGLSKNAAVHVGYGNDKHEAVMPNRGTFGQQRQPLRPHSKRPNRVQRRQEGSDHAREHHERVKHCEAPKHGITTPCRGRLQHSHRIGKGMGGGKDYAVSDGECDILCEAHHVEIDTRRAEMRTAGLSKRRPSPDLPPRRLKSRWES